MSKQRCELISANDLRTGEVCYRTALGEWSNDIATAERLLQAERAEQALQQAQSDGLRVIGAYRIEVECDANGLPGPVHYRDRIRLRGQYDQKEWGRVHVSV